MENSFCIFERECGGWLAVSAPSANFGLESWGATEEEAASRFNATVEIWASLLKPKTQDGNEAARELKTDQSDEAFEAVVNKNAHAPKLTQGQIKELVRSQREEKKG